MNDQNGIKLIDRRVTEKQNFLLDWLELNPYADIHIISQNGDPTEIITKTEDGLGEKKIPIALEIMKEKKLGESKR